MGYGRSFDIGVFGSNFGHAVTQNLPVLANQSCSVQSTLRGKSGDLRQPTSGIYPECQVPRGVSSPHNMSMASFRLEGPADNTDPNIRPTYQRLPTIDAWNLTVQRQLNNTTSAWRSRTSETREHNVFAGDGPYYNVNQPSLGAGSGSDDNNAISSSPMSPRQFSAPSLQSISPHALY